jgi:hypothetical protein
MTSGPRSLLLGLTFVGIIAASVVGTCLYTVMPVRALWNGLTWFLVGDRSSAPVFLGIVCDERSLSDWQEDPYCRCSDVDPVTRRGTGVVLADDCGFSSRRVVEIAQRNGLLTREWEKTLSEAQSRADYARERDRRNVAALSEINVKSVMLSGRGLVVEFRVPGGMGPLQWSSSYMLLRIQLWLLLIGGVAVLFVAVAKTRTVTPKDLKP